MPLFFNNSGAIKRGSISAKWPEVQGWPVHLGNELAYTEYKQPRATARVDIFPPAFVNTKQMGRNPFQFVAHLYNSSICEERVLQTSFMHLWN